jgi:hypothetical protein
MPEATLDRVNSFSSIFEASNQLWNVVRVDVAQAKLAILVVFSD